MAVTLESEIQQDRSMALLLTDETRTDRLDFGYGAGSCTRRHVALASLAHVFVAGGHVAEAIPRQVAAVQMSFPQVKIELLQPASASEKALLGDCLQLCAD